MGMTIVTHPDGSRIFLDATVHGEKDETYNHIIFCSVCAPQGICGAEHILIFTHINLLRNVYCVLTQEVFSTANWGKSRQIKK